MRVAGFSLASNAVRLQFPLREALRSIQPLCDHIVLNLGPSDDGTEQLVAGLDGLEIIHGEWDRTAGGAMLAVETQRALDRIEADWAVYIQADEVLHEEGVEILRRAMRDALEDRAVEGLLVEFQHCYGTPDWEGAGRQWYRREVRVVRPGIGVASSRHAQGFRVGPGQRRVRARRTRARYIHYGWARPMEALHAKREADNQIYYGGEPRRAAIGARLPRPAGLRRFRGTHPAVMTEWLSGRRPLMSDGFDPAPWSWRRVQLHASLVVERLTGWRPFEYRNYVEV